MSDTGRKMRARNRQVDLFFIYLNLQTTYRRIVVVTRAENILDDLGDCRAII